MHLSWNKNCRKRKWKNQWNEGKGYTMQSEQDLDSAYSGWLTMVWLATRWPDVWWPAEFPLKGWVWALFSGGEWHKSSSHILLLSIFIAYEFVYVFLVVRGWDWWSYTWHMEKIKGASTVARGWLLCGVVTISCHDVLLYVVMMLSRWCISLLCL